MKSTLIDTLSRRSLIVQAAAALCAIGAAGSAIAQQQPHAAWPTKPIRLVVGFPGSPRFQCNK